MEQMQFDSSMLESQIVRYEEYLKTLGDSIEKGVHKRTDPMLFSMKYYCDELNDIRGNFIKDDKNKLTTIIFQNEYSFLDKGDYYNCRGLVYYFLNVLNVTRDLYINKGDFEIDIYTILDNMITPFKKNTIKVSELFKLFEYNEETKRFDGSLKDSISNDIKALDKLTQEILPNFENSLRKMDYDSRYLTKQIEQKKSLGEDTSELDNSIKELSVQMAQLQKNIENTVSKSDELYDILIKQYDEIELLIYDKLFKDVLSIDLDKTKDIFHLSFVQENIVEVSDEENRKKEIVRKEYFVLHDSLSFEIANAKLKLG